MKKIAIKSVIFVLVISLSIGAIMGCSNKGNKVIKVGSKNFTESIILAELYSYALEKNGYTVEKKLNLGATSVAHPALVKGDIDLYPEYTGTGLTKVLNKDALFDQSVVYSIVKKDYHDQFKLEWLDYSEANDSQGLVITKKASDLYGIKTITDLQKNADKLRFASQGEFELASDGLPAITKVYGTFNFKSTKVYDNALKYEVLHSDNADISVAYTTEGQLSNAEFVVLEDDKHAWSPYNIAPVVREDTLSKYTDVKEILNAITKKLTTKVVQSLNAQVDIDKKEPVDVAKAYYDKEFGK